VILIAVAGEIKKKIKGKKGGQAIERKIFVSQ